MEQEDLHNLQNVNMSVFVYKPSEAKIGFGTKSLRMLEILSPYLIEANKHKYDFVDCAWRYGNEAMIGLALKDIKESDMSFEYGFVFQSKVWPSQFAGGIAKSLKFTFSKIGAISSIDSYALHRPSTNIESNVNAWKQLLDCKRNRQTKKVGLCHFDSDLMELLFKSTNSRPDFLQCELSVNNMRYDRISYCRKHNIEVQSCNPLGVYSKNEKNPILIKMAKKYNTEIKNILLSFLLNQNITPIVVPTSADEIGKLIKSKEIILSQEDMIELSKLNEYETTEPESFDYDI